MRLNNIFSSHMVFASRLPIRIYGTGTGKAKITFAGKTVTVTSVADNWFIEFSPMDYGGPYELIFETDDKSTVLNDIYIGEVFLFAGQSNIEFKLKSSSFDTSLYESCDNLRLFSTDRIDNPDFYTARDGWVKCEKENAGEWSALAYLAGVELAKAKNIAIGIIACYQGASVIESWVPAGSYLKHGINLLPEQKHHDHFDEHTIKWNTDGTLYSYALSQVIPFSLSAVVWYQGESDTSPEEADIYCKELSILIDIWRNAFRIGNLPFLVVQIANYTYRNDEAWKTLQKAQYEIQYVRTGVKSIISADVCESNNIHPPTKTKLGERISEALKEIISLI